MDWPSHDPSSIDLHMHGLELDADDAGAGAGSDAAMMGATFDAAWNMDEQSASFGGPSDASLPIPFTSSSTSHSAPSTTNPTHTSFSFPAQSGSTMYSNLFTPQPPTGTLLGGAPQSMPTSTLFGGLGKMSSSDDSPPLRSIRLNEEDERDDDDDEDDELMPFGFGNGSSSPSNQDGATIVGTFDRRLSVLSSEGSPMTGSLASITGLGSQDDVLGEQPADVARPNKRARTEVASGSPAPSFSAKSASGVSSVSSASNKVNAAISTVPSAAATAAGGKKIKALKGKDKSKVASSANTTDDNLLAPPPAPKRPWNTSPQSTHLPSGSQLINPLTNELDLKPELLEGLTKEEIRKVKNRASAQRSRTRKWEVQEGLKGENERLREELERLRAEMEGNDEEAAAPVTPARDEEKEALKALVEKLRAQVRAEQAGRMKAEAEVWSLKAQLESLTRVGKRLQDSVIPAGIPSPANSSEDEIMSIHGSESGPSTPGGPHRSVDMHGGAAEKGEMRKTIVPHAGKSRAAGKDPKGVLMMVVLFSFALFTFPPHLRSTSYPTYLPLNSNALPLSELPRPGLGRVLSFEDGDKVLRNNSAMDESGLVMVTSDEDAACDASYGERNRGALCSASSDLGDSVRASKRRGAARGRKSFSFTLLRPINEDEEASATGKENRLTDALDAESAPSADTHGNEVEDVLQRWLGLSLFEAGNADQDRNASRMQDQGPAMPNGWIVVDSSAAGDDDGVQSAFAAPPTSRRPVKAEVKDSPRKAWDGSELEMMDLDTEMLSISAGPPPANPNDLGLYPPTHDIGIAPSPTLAPQVLEDPLAEDDDVAPRSLPSALPIPGAFPPSPPSRRLGSMPSTALMAFGQHQAEKYMKVELEVDIEVEVSCTGVRRKKDGPLNGKRMPSGLSVVGKDEVGRILSSGNAAAQLDGSAVEERGLALRGMVADMSEAGLSSGWKMV